MARRKRRHFRDSFSTSEPDPGFFESIRRVWNIIRRSGIVGALFCLVIVSSLAIPTSTVILRGVVELLAYDTTKGRITEYSPPYYTQEQTIGRDGQLRFDYTVGQKHYEGVYPPKYTVHMPRAPFPLLMAPPSVGKVVDVYYDPSHPDRCTLEPRIEPTIFFFLTFLAPFAVFSFVMLIKAIRPRIVEEWKKSGDYDLPLILYFVLSALLGVGLVELAEVVSWQTACIVGVLLPTVIIPSLVLCVRRYLNKRESAPTSFDDPRPPSDHKRRRQLVGLSVATVFWWACISVFVWHAGSFWTSVVWNAITRDSTQGTVQPSAKVAQNPVRRDTDLPRITCHYEIAGHAFDMEPLELARAALLSPIERAEQLRAHFSPGQKVFVLYDPANPENAVVDSFTPDGIWIETIVTTPAVAIGLLIIWAFVRALLHREETTVREDPDAVVPL